MRTETSILNLTALRWRNHAISTGVAGSKRRLSPTPAVTTIAANGNGDFPVVTMNAHRFQVGDWVILSAASAGYEMLNVKCVVTNVTANTFTVRIKGAGDLAAGVVNITVTFPTQAQRVIVTAGANAVAVTLGTDSVCDYYPLQPNQSYQFEAPFGAKFDLSDLYCTAAADNQTVQVLYI